MREKPSIRHTSDGWTVKIPAYGFNDPVERSFPTHKAAGEWLAKQLAVSCDSGHTERANQRADSIAAIPAWEPYHYRYPYRF